MASQGSSNQSLVALENIVIRLNTDSDIAAGQEPEVDIEETKVIKSFTVNVLKV